MKGWPVAIVAGLALLIHAAALGHGFVFDDHQIIEANPLVTQPGRLAEIFSSHYWHPLRERGYLYRPLTILSFRLDHLAGGGSPLAFHLTSLLLHAAASALLLLVLQGGGLVPRAAALPAALLFAAHPVHVEAVAGLAGRADLLAAVFFLAAWRLHQARRPWASMACFGAAMLSKESAVALPAIVVLEEILARPAPARAPAAAIRRAAGLAAVLIACLALRAILLGGAAAGDLSLIHPMDNPAAYAPASIRILTALKVLLLDARLLFFPAMLSADYSYDQIPLAAGPGEPASLAGLGLLLVSLGVAWAGRRPPGVPAFCVLFVLLCLLPVSNLLLPIGTIAAERLLYLPSAGWCAGIAAGTDALGRRLKAPSAAAAAATAILALILSARSVARVGDWRDDRALFLSAAASSPRSAKAQYNAGMELLEAGDAAGALAYLARAADNARGLSFGRADMLRDLATAQSRVGRLDEAIGTLEKARVLEPRHTGILVNLGNAHLARGESAVALRLYDEALALQPDHSGARMNRAGVWLRSGRAAEAAEELARVARDAPSMTEALYLLGEAQLAAGRAEEGLASLRLFVQKAGPDQADRVRLAKARIARGAR